MKEEIEKKIEKEQKTKFIQKKKKMATAAKGNTEEYKLAVVGGGGVGE